MRGLSAKDERNNSDFYPAVFCFTTLLHSKKPYVMRLKGNYYWVTKQVSSRVIKSKVRSSYFKYSEASKP